MTYSPRMEGLSPFPSLVLQVLFNVAEFILRLFIYCLTGAVGPFLPTTVEKNRKYYLGIQKILIVPIYSVGLVLLLLPMLLAFLIRNVLHQFRRPFCLSVRKELTSARAKSALSVATANLCLMPELLSKYNNLDKTAFRATKMGERLVFDQTHYTGMMESCLSNCKRDAGDGCIGKPVDNVKDHSLDKLHNIIEFKNTDSRLKVDIVTHFPHLDFLCLQETFDRDFAKLLLAQLHKVYPWIVYDVGYTSPRLNYCGLNSGLMFASRYEILDIRFKQYAERCGAGSIIGKGLLMVKVCIERNETGRHDVGYMFNTHLQAFQGEKAVVDHQLTEILLWTQEFRSETVKDSDHVLFDIICGDFNMDNMSPGEIHLAKHKLFDTYVDICRERPGKDHSWTIGTELRTRMLHDEAISTPERLKRTIQDPFLRQHYLIDADIKIATMEAIYNACAKKDCHGNLILSTVGGKRRIDIVLYRKHDHVTVQNYNFVTSLAPHTDHIPVAATYTCS